MKSKYMQLPRAVLVGKDTISQVTGLVEDLKLKGKAVVISDNNTYEIAGRKVGTFLAEDSEILEERVSGASHEEVERIKKIFKSEGASYLIGVGGGSVIDVAKVTAKETGSEFLSVPTAASHDGIASSRASIKKKGGSVSVPAIAPMGVLADTKIIQGAPYRLMAAGCGDIISKYTAVRDWELAHKVNGEEISEYSTALSLMTAKIVVDSSEIIRGGGDEGVRKVVKALISSGVAMSIAGSSRPGSGSEHKFSHALDIIAPKPALHGEQCGVGAIIMMYFQGGEWKKIKAALLDIGAPTTAEELGIPDDYIVRAIMKAKSIRPQRYTILEHLDISERQAENAAKKTGVIG